MGRSSVRVHRRQQPPSLALRLYARILPTLVVAGGVFGIACLFADRWLPITTGKTIAGIVLTLGLALSFDTFRQPMGPRTRRARLALRGHADRFRHAWPVWRSWSAIFTGAALVVLGIGQTGGWFGAQPINPISSGMCMIVVGGLGGVLLIVGVNSIQQRRRIGADVIEEVQEVFD